jgi:Xaa-Pro dipeptidase
MRITPIEELSKRSQALQVLMDEQGLEGVLIMQNADLFYFTGSIQQGVLFIPVTGNPLYLVRRDYNRALNESGLKDIVPFKSPKQIPGILAEFGHIMPRKAGMELDVVPASLFSRFQEIFTNCLLVDASPLIRAIRSIKSQYEIEIMKTAALQVDKAYRRAREVIRAGMTDLELVAELEFTLRKEGHQGITRMRGFNAELFYGHVFSGADSAAPAFVDAPLGGIGVNPSIGQGAGYNCIEENQPIIVDFLGAYDGYMVDQTRTLCIGGLPDKLRKAYRDMCRIQERLKEIAVPGIPWGNIYEECYNFACQLGYKENFMGASGSQVSFIGHGIGIEVDEFPLIARGFEEQELQKMMAFAFEPKAVFPGLGSVGIENTFMVDEEGLNSLTFSNEELVVL